MDDHDERAPLLSERRVEDEERCAEPLPTATALADTPIPWASLIALWSLNTVPGLAFEIIYPFVNQMILDIGVTDDPERVGFYSGLVESLFAAVQVITIVPCSYASDYFGRKVVVLVGIGGVAVSMVLFGMSKSFLAMLLSRGFGGALGGSWAAIRVMTAESFPRSLHGMAFTGMATSYRIGQIVGLPLGGVLAHPDKRIPLFSGQFWREYPYALPCFTGAGFAVLAVVIGYLTLHETLKERHLPNFLHRRRARTINGTSPPSDESAIKAVSLLSVMTWPVINLLITNFGTVIFSEMLFSLYPLFGFTPIQSGGLGLSEAEIGIHMSVRAIVHILMLFAYPAWQRRVGTAAMYQIATALWPVTIALFPVASILSSYYGTANHWTVLVAVATLFLVWSVASFTWMCCSILFVEISPTPAALARVNALAQISIVIPQAICPALGTSLFAFSTKYDVLHGFFVWVLLFVLSCIFFLHSLTIHDNPRQ